MAGVFDEQNGPSGLVFDDGKALVIMFVGPFFFFFFSTPAHAKPLLVINLERASLENFSVFHPSSFPAPKTLWSFASFA